MNEDWLLIEAPNSGVEHHTIQESVTHETRLMQQSHGPGRFAIVALTLTPNSSQMGVRFKQTLTLRLDTELFVRCTPPRPLSSDEVEQIEIYVDEVRTGVQDALSETGKSAFVTALDVVLTKVKIHDVDTRSGDFRRAASIAIREALIKAKLRKL
jgi:translation elongation factor EF-G